MAESCKKGYCNSSPDGLGNESRKIPSKVVQRLQELVAQPDAFTAILKAAAHSDPALADKLMAPILEELELKATQEAIPPAKRSLLPPGLSAGAHEAADPAKVHTTSSLMLPGLVLPPTLTPMAVVPQRMVQCPASATPDLAPTQRQPPIGAPPFAVPKQRARQSTTPSPQPVASTHGNVQETRRHTLVLAYLPKCASERDVCAKLDQALRTQHAVQKCRIVRDERGASACYGFFEFRDTATMERVMEICTTGRIVMDDHTGHAWHIRASRSKRATVGGPSRRHRGRRGGGKIEGSTVEPPSTPDAKHADPEFEDAQTLECTWSSPDSSASFQTMEHASAAAASNAIRMPKMLLELAAATASGENPYFQQQMHAIADDVTMPYAGVPWELVAASHLISYNPPSWLY